MLLGCRESGAGLVGVWSVMKEWMSRKGRDQPAILGIVSLVGWGGEGDLTGLMVQLWRRGYVARLGEWWTFWQIVWL